MNISLQIQMVSKFCIAQRIFGSWGVYGQCGIGTITASPRAMCRRWRTSLRCPYDRKTADSFRSCQLFSFILSCPTAGP